MLLFLILLFFGSRLTPYLCLLKWCFCFNLFFTLIFLLIFVVLLVGALSFFPALSLGPVAEFFQMIA